MSSLDDQVVELIAEGWARWKIAEQLGIGETRVRNIIKRLCSQYQCTMRELPQHYRKEDNGGR